MGQDPTVLLSVVLGREPLIVHEKFVFSRSVLLLIAQEHK